MRSCLLLMVLAVTGCGKGGGGGSNASSPQQATPSTSMLVDNKDALPTCDTSRNGQLAYVKGESKFYGCDGASWAEISIKGDKGDTGTAGTDNSVTATYYCALHLTNNAAVDLSHYWAYYSASQLKSGDLFVSGTISNDAGGYSNSRLYAKTQTGVDQGKIVIENDAYGSADSGYWELTLDRGTLQGTIKYTDTAVSGGYRSWVYISTDCTKTSY